MDNSSAGGRGVSEFILYGLNADDETAFCEMLRDVARVDLPAVARERLKDWHAVEIWEGPICLVRMRRPSP